jgi:hypothetical protein
MQPCSKRFILFHYAAYVSVNILFSACLLIVLTSLDVQSKFPLLLGYAFLFGTWLTLEHYLGRSRKNCLRSIKSEWRSLSPQERATYVATHLAGV